MNKTTTSKVLLIIAAGIQSIFLLINLSYGWDIRQAFYCIFIILFILLAVNKKKIFQVLMAFIYFAYSIINFMMRIERMGSINYIFIFKYIALYTVRYNIID
jgi:hypothetical protein